ncbi:MAG: PTS system mannose/fructose/sorbose family transporter subunit IID, partial [Erysipelotrichaceae bacterium]|nr:PTS system mannose/fructose/sorbose family transporter subunit IID [Erysipelotrichaceae bacterium]
MDFINTHPFLVTFVMGIVLSMEQQKMDITSIRAVRVAAMGPLGGIGDAIFWMTLLPIAAGISANFALQGNFFGPVLFLLIFNGVQFALRFWLMHWSYNMGTNAITMLTQNAKEFTHAATILGVLVVGALISNYGGTTIAWTIPNGESPIVLQSVLDSVMPKLIPLGITLGLYVLLAKKNWKVMWCIFLLLAIGIIGAIPAIGMFA